ncbi:hypothetical protein ES708_22449 [subsurface metagenome]
MEIISWVISGLMIGGVLIGGVLFLRWLWILRERDINNSKKED